MPRDVDLENLRFCLDNLVTEDIFIRLMGSHGGTVKVKENLKNKKLDFNINSDKLYFFIDSREVFQFKLEKDDKGFAIEYNRYDPKNGSMIILGAEEEPYDPKLPEPRYSTFRNVLDYHLIEIGFNGRIDLKFHSWWREPHWKYWTVDKEKMLKKK